MAETLQFTLYYGLKVPSQGAPCYQLLIEGLVVSPAGLLQGETAVSELKVVPVKFGLRVSSIYPDGSEHPPEAASNPCMKAANNTENSEFIYDT